MQSPSFLPSSATDSEHVDPRDLSRAQRELGFVAKYVRQQRGNYDNAFNQMVRERVGHLAREGWIWSTRPLVAAGGHWWPVGHLVREGWIQSATCRPLVAAGGCWWLLVGEVAVSSHALILQVESLKWRKRFGVNGELQFHVWT